MIVEKLKQKQWFDDHLKDKSIVEGGLVLLFSVKNQKKKLKYRGLGPFRVVEITPQGAVKLSTLDGVEMEGYINRSRLKAFYGPLTENMLKSLHKTQQEKKQHEEMKREAQREAKALDIQPLETLS